MTARSHSRDVPSESQANVASFLSWNCLCINILRNPSTFASVPAPGRICDDGFLMPSPIGHALAGLTVGLLADQSPLRPGTSSGTLRLVGAATPLALACAAVAALPDADLLIPGWHRTATHSVTATALVFILTIVVTGKVTGKPQWRWAAALAAAHATHLLLDWLAIDPRPPSGIQLFWPFSHEFFISRLDIFPGTERRIFRPGALALNARSAMRELLIMLPIAAAALWVRLRRGRG